MRVVWRLIAVLLWAVAAFCLLFIIVGLSTKDWGMAIFGAVFTPLMALPAWRCWQTAGRGVPENHVTSHTGATTIPPQHEPGEQARSSMLQAAPTIPGPSASTEALLAPARTLADSEADEIEVFWKNPRSGTTRRQEQPRPDSVLEPRPHSLASPHRDVSDPTTKEHVSAELPIARPPAPKAPAEAVTKLQPTPNQKSKSVSARAQGNTKSVTSIQRPIRPKATSTEPARSRRSHSQEVQGLFGYATNRSGLHLNVPFSVVDVETTGFSPARGDRIIEIAIARVLSDGTIEDEFCTLVNPQGRDVGPTFVHHITNEHVRNAPTFSEIADEVLRRLSGTVVVAHNAQFEERFLDSELGLTGITGAQFPALCTMQLAQQVMSAPNYKLGTIAREFGIAIPDAHAALGDVRATAKILPQLLTVNGSPLAYPLEPYTHVGSGSSSMVSLVTRAASLRKGTEGWMTNLVSRLPMNGNAISDNVGFVYFESLTSALEDGRILGDEAKELARIAGQAGLGSSQVQDLNSQFLESLREAALADDILTAGELGHLARASAALGLPNYFDDLNPSDAPAPSADEKNPEPKKRRRRCGNCGEIGHYRPTCPKLS